MKTEMKKAAASTATKKNKLLRAPYQNFVPSSNLKEQVGQLLLNLQSQSEAQRQWQVFESKLRQYIDLKCCGVNL